jgi:hypothetical protein
VSDVDGDSDAEVLLPLSSGASSISSLAASSRCESQMLCGEQAAPAAAVAAVHGNCSGAGVADAADDDDDTDDDDHDVQQDELPAGESSDDLSSESEWSVLSN